MKGDLRGFMLPCSHSSCPGYRRARRFHGRRLEGASESTCRNFSKSVGEHVGRIAPAVPGLALRLYRPTHGNPLQSHAHFHGPACTCHLLGWCTEEACTYERRARGVLVKGEFSRGADRKNTSGSRSSTTKGSMKVPEFCRPPPLDSALKQT